MNQEKTILIISVAFGVTLIAFGFLVRYYRNEIQRLNNYLQAAYKSLSVTKEWKNELLETSKVKSNKILELINSRNILKNQNLRYSKICRKLYDENQNLKLEIQGVESLFQDMKNKANEFDLKITELENKKKRKKG